MDDGPNLLLTSSASEAILEQKLEHLAFEVGELDVFSGVCMREPHVVGHTGIAFI